MADSGKTSSASQSQAPPGTHLDCSKADIGVWLVKVPKYLAKKWNDAPENSEVGVIRITQSKVAAPKPKQEVVFHLNESIAKFTKPGELEEKVPIEHKFVMTPVGSQAMYILRQSEENSKENLSIIGKVMQRAECNPVQNDTSYLQLKKKEAQKFIEPKRQIQMANIYTQKTHFLPRSTASSVKPNQGHSKKDQHKRSRKEKETVLDDLFNAFTKHQYYTMKDLVKLTKQPLSYLKDIVNEICRFNLKGSHKNTWELKDEYKQGELNTDAKKKALEKVSSEKDKSSKENEDDFMEDEDDEDDDFDDDIMDDDTD